MLLWQWFESLHARRQDMAALRESLAISETRRHTLRTQMHEMNTLCTQLRAERDRLLGTVARLEAALATASGRYPDDRAEEVMITLGSLRGCDATALAAVLRLGREAVQAQLDALESRGLVAADTARGRHSYELTREGRLHLVTRGLIA